MGKPARLDGRGGDCGKGAGGVTQGKKEERARGDRPRQRRAVAPRVAQSMLYIVELHRSG